jgi:phage shock protein C
LTVRKTFSLDKSNAKLWGVCAGISRSTGLDPTLVRVAIVIATLLLPWLLLAYAATAVIAKPRRTGAVSLARRDEERSLDRRLMEIELHVAGADSRLAREIDSLR